LDPTSQFDDERLVLLSLSGNQDAFGDLVRKYEKAVYALVYGLVPRAHEAEDLAQDSFLAAYQSLPHLRDPGRFPQWLRGIALRVTQNFIRKKARREKILQRYQEGVDPGANSPDDVSKTAQEVEIHSEVRKAILELPERMRFPVLLRYMEGLSYEEIASFLGLTHSAVRGLLYRASQVLRRRLYSILDEGDETWKRTTQ